MDKGALPLRQLVSIALLVFLAETALMLFVHSLVALPVWAKILVDAGVLTAILIPLFYYYLYNPAALEEANKLLLAEVSDRKRAEEELKQRQEDIAALLASTRAVLTYREFPVAARAIFDSCKNLIGATAGYVALLTPDGAENEVLFLEAGGRECTVDPTLPMPIRGLRAESYHLGKAVYDNDFANSKWWKFMPGGHVHLDNVLFAPLMAEGKAVGLLGIANKPGGFNDHDARMAEAFGEMASVALINSHTMGLLENSEGRFRSIVQTANDAIITINSKGEIALWSNAASTMFGYSVEEAIGKPLSIIIPEQYREQHEKGLARVLSGGPSRILGKTVEVSAASKDGREFPIELSLAGLETPEGKFFTGIVRDISERKRMSEALQESNDRLEQKVRERTSELEEEISEHKRAKEYRALLTTAIEQSADMVVVTDVDGMIQYVNPAYERTSGFLREDVIGRPMPRPHGRSEEDTDTHIWETIRVGKIYSGVIHDQKKDGTYYDAHATFSPIFDSAGKIANYVAVKRDVTYESMLHKARDYFTTITSHELRTPITKLQLVKALLDDLPMGGVEAERASRIRVSLDESFRDLKGILDATTLLSDLNRPKVERRMSPMYLYLDVETSLTNTRLFIEKGKRNITLEADLKALPKDTEIIGDQGMVMKAIENIFSNAIKYTPDGKGLYLSGRIEDGFAVVSVRDEGRGIPTEKKDVIFEPYFSLEDTLHHATAQYAYGGGGLGLGITLSKMVMEYHGGSLSISSAGENQGTTVTMKFPLAKRPA